MIPPSSNGYIFPKVQSQHGLQLSFDSDSDADEDHQSV